MAVLSVLALCAIGFGIATRFYWAKTRGATHDTWYHLHIADHVRRTRRLPDRVDQFIIPGPYDYPPVLHLLLAVFPEEFVLRYKWVFGPVVDTVHLVLVGATTYWLTGDVVAVLVAGSIYATYTTQVVQFTALTPRVLGAILVSALVLLVFHGVQTGTVLPLAAAVLIGVVLLHTHKMSSQTVLFLFLFLSAIWLDPTYVGIVALMVVVAVVVSRGQYVTILRGHVNIINFWRWQHNAGRSPGEFRRRFGTAGSDEGGPNSSLVRLLVWVKRNEWTMFVADNVWTFALAGVLAWTTFGAGAWDGSPSTFGPGAWGGSPTTFTEMLAVWALFILGFAILTQYVPYFKLVGDGYKYFMWGAFPTAVVLAVILPQESAVWAQAGYVVVVVGSALYSFTRMYFRVSGLDPSSRTITTDGKAVLDFIERSDGDNVFLLPFGMSFHVLYDTDLNVLFHQNPKVEAESAFPVPIDPLEDIVRDFDVDWIVIDTTAVDSAAFDTDAFTPVLEDSGYLVLQLTE